MPEPQIVDVRAQDSQFIEQLATLTYEAFRVHAPDWLTTIDAAREVVQESLLPDRHSWALVDAFHSPLAWVGVIPEGTCVWEIHPIAVRSADRGKGYGRRLIEHVEHLARSHDMLTLFASTSDETGATSLSGVDLYENPAAALATARWPASHACEFWRGVGFHLVGVLPDAEGKGKPSIHFARKVARCSTELMQLQLNHALEVLERTPGTFRALLEGVTEAWTAPNEGPETFSAFDNVGHLIHGEKTDWIPRARIIRAQGPNRRFEPYDRFAQYRESKEKTMSDLVDEFASLRAANLVTLREWKLTDRELALEGEHPELGTVTLRQLLATWVVHDLGHVAQTTRVMAKQYREAVGPWRVYLPVLDRP